MWRIRPVEVRDGDQLISLAASLGPGMTTFPSDPDAIVAKVDAAVESFAGTNTSSSRQYLMVLEDTDESRICGVSAVYPEIGRPFGFFSYHLDKVIHHSAVTQFNMEVQVLNLSNAYTGTTEIGTLAVAPDVRGSGAGRLLARARYMLMASFPHLFADYVIAEMRGWQNDDGSSPFWSAVGEKFFEVDFPTADKMSAIKGAEWFAALLPKNPLYLRMLPTEAQDCVGKAHATSAIALQMLLDEGFRFENFVDVFDAGPQVIAPLSDIKTVRESRTLELGEGPSDGEPHNYLVCNNRLADFSLVKARAVIKDGTILLDRSAQELLDASIGDRLRVVPA